MTAGGVWRVVIHNDHVNSVAVVVHFLQTFCAMALAEAMHAASTVHHHGSVEIAGFPDQAAAEHLVVAFQRRGIDASIRGS
jgi:ATP-dependent Clp protease adapter protein ClpS